MTEEEIETVVERVASDIVRRGLQTPAILLLESHKPLAGVIGHASVIFAPLALPLVGFDRYTDLSRLISRRENVERLLRRIEALSAAATATKES
jgi:hypothetical protein